MKYQLSLIRHAKSSWNLPLEDKLRPLNEVGIQRAIVMREHVQTIINDADYVFSSPAVRAHSTANLMLKGLPIMQNSFEIIPELYTFDVRQLETFVKKLPSSLSHVFLFGHNSAITDFVNKFGDRYIENVPTSGWVTIEFDCENWSQIQKGITVRFRTPRD